MDERVFRTVENWHGSYYELCIELGPAGDDPRLLNALRCLWSRPELHGSWTDRDSYGSDVSDFQVTDGCVVPQFGVLTIGDSQLGCVTHIVRETDGSDWLDLCVPTGMLELAYDVSYPLDLDSNPWIKTLNAVFTALATTVFQHCPFRLAIIGEEASGVTDADSITFEDLRRGLFVMTDATIDTLGAREFAIRCADGLYAVGEING